VKLEAYIDWNIFAPILAVVFSKPENSSNAGQMVDASFVETPRQRNTHEENKEVKVGKTPEA